MRDEPTLIGRVAGEAAAEMIVDAAFGDVVERELGRLERIVQSVAKSGAPKEVEELRLRKFRRAADAAMLRIDKLDESRGKSSERGVGGDFARFAARLRFEPRLE